MVLSFSCALIFWGGWPVFILFFACVFWVLKNLADGFCTSSFYQSDVLSIFFFLSFFVVFVFGFWIFEGLVCKSKMMRLTWLNLMWNSISLVFKVLWSLYCTVVMCILFGEMNLLLKAFLNVPFCLIPRFCMQSVEQRSFIFIYLKNTPFYFDCNSFCLITPIPQRNALVLWGYDYSRDQIVFSTSAWFGLGSNCSCCTFVTRIANVCFYNSLCFCGV